MYLKNKDETNSACKEALYMLTVKDEPIQKYNQTK